MRRVIPLLLIVAVLFTGCHGTLVPRGEESKRTIQPVVLPAALNEQQKIEITFWAKNDTNKNQTEIYKKAISDFQALYPHITVNMRLYTDYNRIYNDVITNIATATTPDVCITYPDHIATYLTGADTVVPLDSLMADPRFGLGGSEVRFDAPRQEELVPQFLAECAMEGDHYALPYMRSTEALYINKTFVEKLGYTLPEEITWDFIWEVSEAATAKNADGTFRVNGQKVLLPFIYKSTDNMMIQMLRQLDAGYSKGTGEIRIFNDTTRDILRQVADHVRSGAFSTFKISGYPANFLNAGQCIFAIDSTAGATWMGSKAPLLDISADALVDFETEVRPIPQYDPQHPAMISQGPSICLFRKEDPQQMLAAWLFTQYLLTNEVQIAYAQTEGYVPVTLKAQNSDTYQDYLARCGTDGDTHYDVKIKASKILLDNTANTFVTPVFNGSASLRNAAGQMIEDVAKATRRKQTVDDAFLEKLFPEVTSLYRLDQIQVTEDAQADLGPLPKTSVILLGILGICWIFIGIYCVMDFLKKKNKV